MMNIKKLYPLLFLLLLVVGSCKKESNGSKTVVYEVAMQPSSSGAKFIVKGEYTNEKGETISVDQEAPFKVTLNDVSKDVKNSFKGYLFCVDTKVIKGSISMKIKNGDNLVFDKTKNIDLTNSSGYTAEELKTETTFSFIEK